MTDPLTDAVKRLKQLQADVERLKAGQDEEGEPRLFIETQDLAVARDSIEVKPEDILELETAVARDALDSIVAETVKTAFYQAQEGYGIRSYGSDYGASGADTLDRGHNSTEYTDT